MRKIQAVCLTTVITQCDVQQISGNMPTEDKRQYASSICQAVCPQKIGGSMPLADTGSNENTYPQTRTLSTYPYLVCLFLELVLHIGVAGLALVDNHHLREKVVCGDRTEVLSILCTCQYTTEHLLPTTPKHQKGRGKQ